MQTINTITDAIEVAQQLVASLELYSDLANTDAVTLERVNRSHADLVLLRETVRECIAHHTVRI